VTGFDRSIPPGAEGKISIRLNPKACQSGAEKSALVVCNDPQKSTFQLVVKGRSN
jgi:hypothetical protein